MSGARLAASASAGCKRLVEVGDDVARVLNAD
jgi:hypothetical protein